MVLCITWFSCGFFVSPSLTTIGGFVIIIIIIGIIFYLVSISKLLISTHRFLLFFLILLPSQPGDEVKEWLSSIWLAAEVKTWHIHVYGSLWANLGAFLLPSDATVVSVNTSPLHNALWHWITSTKIFNSTTISSLKSVSTTISNVSCQFFPSITRSQSSPKKKLSPIKKWNMKPETLEPTMTIYLPTADLCCHEKQSWHFLWSFQSQDSLKRVSLDKGSSLSCQINDGSSQI